MYFLYKYQLIKHFWKWNSSKCPTHLGHAVKKWEIVWLRNAASTTTIDPASLSQAGGRGGGMYPPPSFWQTSLPYLNQGGTLSPPSTTLPLGFSDLATALVILNRMVSDHSTEFWSVTSGSAVCCNQNWDVSVYTLADYDKYRPKRNWLSVSILPDFLPWAILLLSWKIAKKLSH